MAPFTPLFVPHSFDNTPISSLTLPLLEQLLEGLCTEIWADHGDVLAQQYGGSAAMHRVDSVAITSSTSKPPSSSSPSTYSSSSSSSASLSNKSPPSSSATTTTITPTTPSAVIASSEGGSTNTQGGLSPLPSAIASHDDLPPPSSSSSSSLSLFAWLNPFSSSPSPHLTPKPPLRTNPSSELPLPSSGGRGGMGGSDSTMGEREYVLSGGAKNAVVAVQRYYSNISTDFERQQSIDLLLGVFRPTRGGTPIWEIDLNGANQHRGGVGMSFQHIIPTYHSNPNQ